MEPGVHVGTAGERSAIAESRKPQEVGVQYPLLRKAYCIGRRRNRSRRCSGGHVHEDYQCFIFNQHNRRVVLHEELQERHLNRCTQMGAVTAVLEVLQYAVGYAVQ